MFHRIYWVSKTNNCLSHLKLKAKFVTESQSKKGNVKLNVLISQTTKTWWEHYLYRFIILLEVKAQSGHF